MGLLLIGSVMVYSASFMIAHNDFEDDLYFLWRQTLALAIGLVALFGLARLDYRLLSRLSLVIMIACVALLILVLVPGLGTRSYGAVRWIRLGPIQLQPAELAKVALAIYLADWLARRGRAIRRFRDGPVPFAIVIMLVAGLIELQPDLGTTSVIVAAAACVYFVAGANLLHLVALAGTGTIAAFVALVRLSGYRQDRLSAYFDPWGDLQGTGWHTVQTLIALGSGGPTGVGLGGGLHKFYWVPNAHTDAIFAIVGEELGIIGTVGITLLFAVLIWRGFTIARQTTEPFGRLLATSLTCTLGLQAMVNVGVVTNTIPYTGVTLPFVSFGGTSTVVSMAAVGLLLSIARHSPAGSSARGAEPRSHSVGPAPSFGSSSSPRRARPAPAGQLAFWVVPVPPARRRALGRATPPRPRPRWSRHA